MLEKNIEIIRDNIQRLNAPEVLIVAATKMVEPAYINALKDYGILDAGENKVQELVQKYDKVSGIRWHFIGTLQRNKVKYIIDKVCLIHSVDSAKLADEIDKRAEKIDKVMDVLIEVNIGGESSKSGVLESDLFALADHICMLKNVRLKGLMTVLPINADKLLYKSMQNLYNECAKRYEDIQYLSMGMSADYQTALEYGANLIRPGSSIFGVRHYAK